MKIKVVILCILLLLCTLLSFANEIEENKKLLKQIEKELARKRELLKRGSHWKYQYLQDIKFLENRVAYYKTKIKELENKEKQLHSQQIQSEAKILQSNQEINANQRLLCHSLQRFILLDNQRMLANLDIEADNYLYLLSQVIQGTADKLEHLCSQKQELEKDKEKRDRELSYCQLEKKKRLTSVSSVKKNIKSTKEKYAKVQQENLKYQEDIEKLEREAKQLQDLIARLQAEQREKSYTYEFLDKLVWPVQGEIIRNYGEIMDKTYKTKIVNQGIDIEVAQGTPVHSIAEGIVVYTDWFPGKGKLIIIDHRNGFYSLYGHNNNLLVHKGEGVKRNQVIAFSGNTGSRYGYCLHFELRKNGIPVNPLDYLE